MDQAELTDSPDDAPPAVAPITETGRSLVAIDPAELDRLRADRREAAEVLRAIGKAALAVKPTLDKPYPDDPTCTPWTRFMEKPARHAYNLGVRLSR